MLQTPGIPLKQKGDVLRRITTDLSPNEPTFFLFDSGSIKAKVPVPFELRAGFGFQINEETLLSVDAAVTGPVKDGTLFGRPAELEGIDARPGAYFSSSIARRWTPNVAIGAEHKFGKAVVAGGLFTNFSAAPDVPETSQEYTPDQVNMWGASVAIGVDTKGYRFTVGASGLFGKGDALAAVLDENADVVSYRRTGATRAAIILYISGAISVATKGAQQIQQKQKEKKKRKAEGNGEDAGTDTGTDADTDADTGTDAGTDN
jgi:hypothetical protein